MDTNICLLSDSYKMYHWDAMLPDTEVVSSYYEARKGAKFDEVVFFGLQYILKRFLVGTRVTKENIDNAEKLCFAHFGDNNVFNRKGWEYILEKHNGKLPVIIKAIPEGTVVPINNVLMTIENTDPKCYWLTNFLETILSQVWYPCTVATLSFNVKKMIKSYFDKTSDNGLLDLALQDFGYRGATVYEAAGIGGAGNLVHFKGTDTIAAMETAMAFYNAPVEGLAYSVRATEHSVMTAAGEDGEEEILRMLLQKNKKGIISVVGDSFNIYNFCNHLMGRVFKQEILDRDGLFVLRPDSITPTHPTPEEEMLWLVQNIWDNFGGKVNSKGYKVVNDKVRLLWGDGIDLGGIEKILALWEKNGFAAENIACFGMGGGLLQKVNRDTQRFAFKCSAQKRAGFWHDVYKKPKDISKASKKGRLKLIKIDDKFHTVRMDEYPTYNNELITVFENGELKNEISFAEVRANALK